MHKYVVVFRYKDRHKKDEVVATFFDEWLADKEVERLNIKWQDHSVGDYVKV